MKATHKNPAGAKASNAKASEAKECSFFARTGNCNFGDQCKFRHTQRPPVESADHPTVPCSFFVQKGFCKFGDACKFIHDVRYAKQVATTTTHATTTHKRVVNAPHQKRPAVTDETRQCRDKFSSMDERGQPNGICANPSCPFRHYCTRQEEEVWRFATFGWAPIHHATFFANYQKLAELLSESDNPQALINLPTEKPYVIQWSEHDAVDRCFDRYKITIPARSTAMDIVKTKTADLDRDSENTCSVVEYLADSHSGRSQRQICLTMLNNPTEAMEILNATKQGTFGPYLT